MLPVSDLYETTSFGAKKIHFNEEHHQRSLCGVTGCFKIEKDKALRKKMGWTPVDYEGLPLCIKCEDIANLGISQGRYRETVK